MREEGYGRGKQGGGGGEREVKVCNKKMGGDGWRNNQSQSYIIIVCHLSVVN